jgi:hypothetical protein
MVLTAEWLTRVLVVFASWDRLHAEEVRRGGCPHCGGRLHAGHYRRKAWGWPRVDPREPPADRLTLRWSWCCARRGCRKRLTPASWRFHGRRFYVAPVVLGLAAMATGAAVVCQDWERPCGRTVRRWLGWWRGAFASSEHGVALRGRLAPGLTASRLPGCLLAAGVGVAGGLRALVGGLVLVRPWTGGRGVM